MHNDACLAFHEDEGKLPSQGRGESLAERGQLTSAAEEQQPRMAGGPELHITGRSRKQ